MRLFSKDNDYNLILEKVLDSKYFSSNTKSLLLSMIYKIENCYNDYRKVKAIDKTKEKFLEELINTIKEYCDNIKLVEPDSKGAEIIKKNNVLALTNEKERSILSYPTEIALLYAISDVLPKYFYIPESFLLKNAFQNSLVNGYNQNNLEILADFNGWSWDINVNLKNNIEDNLIYQNFMILFGIDFMDNWQKCATTKENPLDEIKYRFSGTKYFEILCNYLYSVSSEKDRKKIDKTIESKKQELQKISDKPKFFEEIKRKKVRYFKEVEKLDKLLNNKEKLMKKYISENLKLEENKKFKTINNYKKTLEIKRDKYLNEISNLGNMMKPINYIKYKDELEGIINITEIQINGNIIKNLQCEFIKLLIEEIGELDVEDEIVSYIYKIRYYSNLYIDDKKQIKDIKSLKLDTLLKIMIEKACKKSVLRKVSTNEELNFEIIKNILDTKILDLQEIKFEVCLKLGKLKVKVYEKEVYEKDFEIDFENKKELLVKQNKKLKLFI